MHQIKTKPEVRKHTEFMSRAEIEAEREAHEMIASECRMLANSRAHFIDMILEKYQERGDAKLVNAADGLHLFCGGQHIGHFEHDKEDLVFKIGR
jgi:O-methyltransferase involved in polyketide biosynthesis